MPKMFGTDGVRGEANTTLTPEQAMQIGRAGAYVLTKHTGTAPKIMLGKDTRISSYMLEAALIAGLTSVGAQVEQVGVMPSPAMAFLVRKHKMDAGIMLSASHNPMPDNGIKFFDAQGYKLSDALEEEIEKYYGSESLPRPTGAKIGRVHELETAAADYMVFLASTVTDQSGTDQPGPDRTGKPFAGLKVALDCANGATYKVAPRVFEKLGAEIKVINAEPNGLNINENCGSTHLESLQAFVKQNGMDIGLAFDGDGDRVLCVDERGETIDGDIIMAVCGLAMKRQGRLKGDAIVATVMSNMGLQIMCREQNINMYRVKVGDRYVIEKMREAAHNLGGEQSGHIIFSDYNTTGDGILTGLQLLSVLSESGQKMSELRQVMKHLPQVLINVRLKKAGSYKETPALLAAIEAAGARLGDSGRILVRPSGTEPLARVMLEGPGQNLIDELAKSIAVVIEAELG